MVGIFVSGKQSITRSLLCFSCGFGLIVVLYFNIMSGAIRSAEAAQHCTALNGGAQRPSKRVFGVAGEHPA